VPRGTALRAAAEAELWPWDGDTTKAGHENQESWDFTSTKHDSKMMQKDLDIK
jgi:hypothetical protein